MGGQRLEPAGEKGSVGVSGLCRGKGNSEGMQAESMSGATKTIKSTINRKKPKLLRESTRREDGAGDLGRVKAGLGPQRDDGSFRLCSFRGRETLNP